MRSILHRSPMAQPVPVVGWDIGGVNTKVARAAGGDVLEVRQRPFELQRHPGGLRSLLGEMRVEVGAADGAPHAVTMTAELSQLFRTKREGVTFVLDAVAAAFPRSDVRVFGVHGGFLTIDAARQEPLTVAAANWMATACAIARHHRDAALIDIGTTTTDIIPIVAGAVVSAGRTDPERLRSGELVYTGVLRSPTESIASHVPLGHGLAGVSAEGFALAGDVHLWRGNLRASDYSVPTPDGRPATREYAGERLARVVCADRDMLDEAAITAIADALARAQAARIAAALALVLQRHPAIAVAVVTGLGAFLGAAVASGAGLRVVPLAAELGDAAARCAPAASVALLRDAELRAIALAASSRPEIPEAVGAPPAAARPASASRIIRSGRVEILVKVGGGLLAHDAALDRVLTAIDAARGRSLLIVPGGGPFADTVRAASGRLAIGDDAAHWMAILAMDQYAHLLAARLPGAELVTAPEEVRAAAGPGRMPVLAPYQWLRQSDPLPHSWDITSDSIAAWFAGTLDAARLVLIKPPGARGASLVDAHFRRVLPSGLTHAVVAADESAALHSALGLAGWPG